MNERTNRTHCVVSGCKIPQNQLAFCVNFDKAQVLIQAGYLSSKTVLGKNDHVCAEHFNFPNGKIPKRMSLKFFKECLKGSGGGAGFTCGRKEVGKSSRRQVLTLVRTNEEEAFGTEEAVDQDSDLDMDGDGDLNIDEDLDMSSSGQDQLSVTITSESESDSEYFSDEEEWEAMVEEREKYEKRTKLARLGKSSTSIGFSTQKTPVSRSFSLDVIRSLKQEDMVGLLELLSPQQFLELVQKKHALYSSLQEKMRVVEDQVADLNRKLLDSCVPLTWRASSNAGLIEIITGHTEQWIVKYFLDPINKYLNEYSRKRKRGRKGEYCLEDQLLMTLAVGNGVSIGAIQRKIFPKDLDNGRQRVRKFIHRTLELLVEIYGDGKVNPRKDKKVRHLFWKPLTPAQIQQDSRAAQKTTAAPLGYCDPSDLFILIADGSGTITKKPLHFRDNKMFYCSWKKSTQIRWFIVTTALGRILYLSQPYPGFLDDTKAIERRFVDGSSFNKMMEEEYGESIRARSEVLKKPVLSFLGDKGYVYYLPPWIPFESKQGLRDNPLLFSQTKAEDYPCLVLVTDSAKYEVFEAETVGGESAASMTSLVDQFCKRRPFVKLRSDIAPVRSIIERVIGRMKSIFKVIAGPVCRTQILMLSAFMIISVGLINLLISENPELFLQDVGVEERDEKKFEDLWKLVEEW
jgi:hypothetical protein